MTMLQVVALAVGDQVGHAGHRPVVVHDLADHAGGVEPGEAREIDGGLGLADSLEHAARLARERLHVTARAGGRPASRRARSQPGRCGCGRQRRSRSRSPRERRSRRCRPCRAGTTRRGPRSARRPSWSARSSVSDRQICPRACVTMKLIVSGVANCAAMTRSPSFSRSGSSTTTTMRPSRISSIASSMVAKDVVTAMRKASPRCPAGVARRTSRARRPRG